MTPSNLYQSVFDKFTNAGFTVTILSTESDDYVAATVENNKVIGMISEGNLDCNYARNHVIFDNKEIFDKWSKCSLRINLDVAHKYFSFVLTMLEFLGSAEGEEHSNNYEYISSPILPYCTQGLK